MKIYVNRFLVGKKEIIQEYFPTIHDQIDARQESKIEPNKRLKFWGDWKIQLDHNAPDELGTMKLAEFLNKQWAMLARENGVETPAPLPEHTTEDELGDLF